MLWWGGAGRPHRDSRDSGGLRWFILAWPWEAHYRAWQDRSYGTRDLNHYLAHTYRGRGPLLGVWAASANWQCRGRALPVWHDFLHHEEPLATYRPEAVIVEPEEEGCNQAFRRDGIDLAARSDSSRSFQIGPWPVVVYWIKE